MFVVAHLKHGVKYAQKPQILVIKVIRAYTLSNDVPVRNNV
jgi:hypothetical protein